MAYLSKNQMIWVVSVCSASNNGTIGETRIAGCALKVKDAIRYAENEIAWLQENGFMCTQELNELNVGRYFSTWVGENPYVKEKGLSLPCAYEVLIQKSALAQ